MGIILGYWDIRGLAHAIRLLLEYTETPYEDKQYGVGGEARKSETRPDVIQTRFGPLTIDPEFDLSQWTSVKEKLGLDFPNIPYLIDGERKITQSNAIMRYLARKHKMCGETEEEMIRIDILENHIMDFRVSFAELCYSPDFEKLKPEYLEELPGKLKLFSQFLGDRKWFAGNKITYVDFLAYDVLDQQRMFEPKCFNQYKNLQDFFDHFEALEKISTYMKSSRFMKSPILLKNAKWGNEKE
ncbi:glutathione S-transferase Mu 1-like isoform X3 [Pogona vitticeps]